MRIKINDLSQIAEKVIKSGGVEPKFIGFIQNQSHIDKINNIMEETKSIKNILQKYNTVILK